MDAETLDRMEGYAADLAAATDAIAHAVRVASDAVAGLSDVLAHVDAGDAAA